MMRFTLTASIQASLKRSSRFSRRSQTSPCSCSHTRNRRSGTGDDPPSADDPVRLFLSTTDDLAHVSYVAEIVDWHDKNGLPTLARHVFDTIIAAFQPGETKIYSRGVNVLVVRRMIKMDTPLPVSSLLVRSTNALHGVRSSAGGWSVVAPDAVGFDPSELSRRGARGALPKFQMPGRKRTRDRASCRPDYCADSGACGGKTACAICQTSSIVRVN